MTTNHPRYTYAWLAINALAYALGWWLLAALRPLPLDIMVSNLTAADAAILVSPGVLLGIGQWLFLRRSVLPVGAWWVLVGTAQWAFSLPLATFASSVAMRDFIEPGIMPYPFVLLWATALVFIGLLYAFIAALPPTVALALYLPTRRIAVPWMGATTWGLVMGLLVGATIVSPPFRWELDRADSTVAWLALALIGAACGTGQAICAHEYLVNAEHLDPPVDEVATNDAVSSETQSSPTPPPA